MKKGKKKCFNIKLRRRLHSGSSYKSPPNRHALDSTLLRRIATKTFLVHFCFASQLFQLLINMFYLFRFSVVPSCHIHSCHSLNMQPKIFCLLIFRFPNVKSCHIFVSFSYCSKLSYMQMSFAEHSKTRYNYGYNMNGIVGGNFHLLNSEPKEKQQLILYDLGINFIFSLLDVVIVEKSINDPFIYYQYNHK